MTTRQQCISAAGHVLADMRARLALLTPREAAVEAYQPGGPSVDEIEARIRAKRQHARTAA